ncbi:hypothetical protein [Halomonas korlensis]|uniref:Uncharacterized protein n=1 Tax=Halomonas korlensis TaxID=463301 RepID=A0A1I7G0V3_9GAMM|nr:hypothetical protein [Halomonas korlensis]SFU42079.1 hypothetical protein SAMN04487955_102160 [Halomonas korlensis]
MGNNSSQKHVDFLANLMPIYQHDEVDGFRCARSLKNGTLILPIYELDESLDEDWIHVLWQGDSSRKSEVRAYEFASIAVVDYVNFHGVGKGVEYVNDMLLDLAQHYCFKTGSNIYLPNSELNMPALFKVMELAKRVGPKIAYDALKKAIGL